MQDNKLFFIAIIPTTGIQASVNVFKQDAARLFDSNKALTSPPHITLIPPFRWKEADVPKLKTSLGSFAENRKYFSLELNGFDAFEPRVIFIDVVKNKDLNELQNDLEKLLVNEISLSYDRPKRSYHPHMTIAFKDLKPSIFPMALAHFSKIEFKSIFEINHIVLLKHTNKRWEIDEAFLF